MRSSQPATSRAWVPVSRTRRAGDTDRPARSTAASAISRARSAPVHGQVTIQRPASDGRWTSTGPPRLAMVRAQAPGPGDEVRDGVRPLAQRDRAGEVHQRAVAGRPGAVPGPRAPDGDLDLGHRLQPVDVGPLVQPDLQESHGPEMLREEERRGTAVPRLPAIDWGAMAPTETLLVAPDEIAALRASIEAAYPAYLDDLERLVNTDCGSYTKAGVDAIGRFTAERLRTLGFAVTSHDNDQGLGETVIGELHGTDPAGPTLLCIAHMDTVFDPGSAEERPFAIQGGIATGPGVTDMKSGLLTGLYAIAALRDALHGVPVARLLFVANPDEEIGSPVSTPHIRRLAAGSGRVPRPRVRACQRRHRLVAQGHPGPA